MAKSVMTVFHKELEVVTDMVIDLDSKNATLQKEFKTFPKLLEKTMQGLLMIMGKRLTTRRRKRESVMR